MIEEDLRSEVWIGAGICESQINRPCNILNMCSTHRPETRDTQKIVKFDSQCAEKYKKEGSGLWRVTGFELTRI